MGNDNQIFQEIFDSFLTQLLQSKDTQNTDPTIILLILLLFIIIAILTSWAACKIISRILSKPVIKKKKKML